MSIDPGTFWYLAPPFLALGIYYLGRALRISRFHGIVFLVTVAYGVALEYATVRTTHTYFYDNVLVMIGTWPSWVPLSVAVSWASIIFISMRTSDMLGLSWKLRPIVDGAVGVSLDIVSDPVASASRWVGAFGDACYQSNLPSFGGGGIWTWCVPEGDTAMWYNVPLSNFFGYFLIIASLSFFVRFTIHRWNAPDRKLLLQLAMAAGAAVASLAVVAVALLAYKEFLMSEPVQWGVAAALLVGPAALVLALRRRLRWGHPPDEGLLLLPAAFYILSLWGYGRIVLPNGGSITGAAILFAAVLVSAVLVGMPYLGSRRE